MKILLFIVVIFTTNFISNLFAFDSIDFHDYCIIGAGPAGLQMAYFLQKSNRNYVVYERNSRAGSNLREVEYCDDTDTLQRLMARDPSFTQTVKYRLVCGPYKLTWSIVYCLGSFFTTYPRHRQLISLNKRNTGERNFKFNLRHDWNSLLSDNEYLRFTNRSKKLFPSADLIVEYFNDFARHFNLNIRYNTNIENLRPIETCSSIDSCDKTSKRFQMNDQHHQKYTCGVTIVATGLSQPNIPPIVGIELAEGYENVSLNVEEFENQTVLILGRGNAAFEVAKHIYDATSFIHLISRSRVRNSFATHYVGDLRTLNNEILDTYQLKSLDALLELDLLQYELHRRNDDGRFQLIRKLPQQTTTNEEREQTTSYDQVIRCLGFKFDTSIWHRDLHLATNRGRTMKFPKINGDFQSTDVEHLYFAGVATHSLDFRRSSGGFIHGFRYTSRALHRILEHRYHHVKWPSKVFFCRSLVNYLIKRINEADGIYQMFGQLIDVILIDKNLDQCRYIEEYPVGLLDRLEEISGYTSTHLLVLNMQYGMNYSGPGRDVFAFDRVSASVLTADRSNFLHPVLYEFTDGPLKENEFINLQKGLLPIDRTIRVHHIIENLLTSWINADDHILPLRIFIENIFQKNFEQKTMRTYLDEKFRFHHSMNVHQRFLAL